ncbi:hypothetical protein Bca4012_084312 [Brassica carinata]|uniref:Uncharacterized protein n=1 Tax=Brassica carinata TaxID=52824 RepID=A0A8X7SL41_BRACI|nr:hypothetical protein Bca52824_026462 [Brassica carinata]
MESLNSIRKHEFPSLIQRFFFFSVFMVQNTPNLLRGRKVAYTQTCICVCTENREWICCESVGYGFLSAERNGVHTSSPQFRLRLPTSSSPSSHLSFRLLAPPVQSRSVHARFVAKRHEVEQKVENGGGQWKTLDSRFAIMKEQRKSNKNNNNGVKVMHVPRLPPWARARRI